MITIQKCTSTHISLLFDIALQSYKEAYEYLWYDNGAAYIKKRYSKQLWEAEIVAGIGSYFLVYSNQEAVGYFKLKENNLVSYPQKSCLEIEKLYFLKSSTGKGIGKNSLRFIEDSAIEQHKNLIWANVMQSSPAIAFYEKNGFKQIRESYLNYPEMKEEFRTLITFTKDIVAPNY